MLLQLLPASGLDVIDQLTVPQLCRRQSGLQEVFGQKAQEIVDRGVLGHREAREEKASFLAIGRENYPCGGDL